VQAVAAFSLWCKAFYFLRAFRFTAYLIRSVVEVISAMMHFLFVLGIFILMYADVFSNLNKA
jgi:hypothetical protein